MKLAHKIGTYKDGWQQIKFCIVCGVEGLDLNEDCVPLWRQDAQLELFSDSYSKKVDKPEEQH